MFVKKLTRKFQALTLKRTYITEKGVPTIDISKFMNKTPDYKEECKRAAKAFEETGCFAFKDPRVTYSHNDEFLNLMERYFEDRAQKYYKGDRSFEDLKPEIRYQAGITPAAAGKTRELNAEIIKKYTGANKPATPIPIPPNMNWRYLWRIYDKSKNVQSILTEPPQFIPKDFPEFERVAGTWGKLLVEAGYTISRMVAIGLGLEEDAFIKLLSTGSHVLSPTGSDLNVLDVGACLAGFHYDLNFCTIHGKSRFPGLDVWLKDGTKLPVKIPDGYLLTQSGKQMEILTGGHIQAGFHEVIFNEETRIAKEKAIKEGRLPWRVSSTVFLQTGEETILKPLGHFATEENLKNYPPILTSKQVEEEIKEIYRL